MIKFWMIYLNSFDQVSPDLLEEVREKSK